MISEQNNLFLFRTENGVPGNQAARATDRVDWLCRRFQRQVQFEYCLQSDQEWDRLLFHWHAFFYAAQRGNLLK